MLLDLLVYSSKGLTSFMELELIFLPLNTDIKFLALSESLAREKYFQSPPDFRIDYKVFYQARSECHIFYQQNLFFLIHESITLHNHELIPRNKEIQRSQL